jgi:hypothetical protein
VADTTNQVFLLLVDWAEALLERVSRKAHSGVPEVTQTFIEPYAARRR